MLKITSILALFFFTYSTVAIAAPVIMVANDTKLGSITFGYTSYKIVNGSSTRRGSGATISVGLQGEFSSFPPLQDGDQISLDQGLRIYNQDRSMSSDGSPTCDTSGFANGLSRLFGRNYMLQNDRFNVEITADEGVIPTIYDAVCTYSK
jgi:hypothetical protein